MKKKPARKQPQGKPAGKAKTSPAVHQPPDEAEQGIGGILAQRVALFDESTRELIRLCCFDDYRRDQFLKLTQLLVPDPKPSNPPQPEEWDFRSLRSTGEAERERCLEYELSREVILWRTIAYNHRRASEGKSYAQKRLSDFALTISFPRLIVALNFSEWPNTPWLALEPSTRQRTIKWRNWPSLQADPAYHWNGAFSRSRSMEVKEKYGKALIYPNFQIDLYQHDFTIINELSNWLEVHRKKQGKQKIEPVERRGARTATDVLKSLGAYRLLKVMKWDDAKEIFESNGIHSLKDETAWSKAGERAEVAIRQFAKGEPLSVVLRSSSKNKV